MSRKRHKKRVAPRPNPSAPRARSSKGYLELDEGRFWRNILRAVEADPRDVTSIRGASGLEHALLAVGVDSTRRRLVVVSDDADAQSAAVAQADIQAAHPDVRVVLARPIGINLSGFAQSLAATFGHAWIGPNDWQWFRAGEDGSFLPETMDVLINAFKEARRAGHLPMGLITQIVQALQQIAHLDLRSAGGGIGISHFLKDISEKNLPIVGLERLAAHDALTLDRELGICGIPLYKLSEEDLAIVGGQSDIDDVRAVLTASQIYQYFFPPIDQLTLALIDRGKVKESELLGAIAEAPKLGHPLAPGELIEKELPIPEIVSVLKDKKYVCEGEIGLEVGPEGRILRTNIRFQPREGLVSKVLNRLSVNIDLKDLWDMFRGPTGT